MDEDETYTSQDRCGGEFALILLLSRRTENVQGLANLHQSRETVYYPSLCRENHCVATGLYTFSILNLTLACL